MTCLLLERLSPMGNEDVRAIASQFNQRYDLRVITNSLAWPRKESSFKHGMNVKWN